MSSVTTLFKNLELILTELTEFSNFLEQRTKNQFSAATTYILPDGHVIRSKLVEEANTI
jgi:hypothetical protein